MTGRSIITSSWLTLQTVNEVYIIKWAIPSFFRKHYHQNTIFSISEMSERNAGTYLIICQVVGKKKRRTTYCYLTRREYEHGDI